MRSVFQSELATRDDYPAAECRFDSDALVTCLGDRPAFVRLPTD